MPTGAQVHPNYVIGIGRLDPNRVPADPRKTVHCYVVNGDLYSTTYHLGWTPKDTENRPSEILKAFVAKNAEEANKLTAELRDLPLEEARARVDELFEREVHWAGGSVDAPKGSSNAYRAVEKTAELRGVE